MPEGHTAAAWPVLQAGVNSHIAKAVKDSDAACRERARFKLIGNAVTVPVRCCDSVLFWV